MDRENEFTLLDKLAIEIGLAQPESFDERYSTTNQIRVLRQTLKHIKESPRSPGCYSSDNKLAAKEFQAVTACIAIYENIQRSTVNDMPMEIIMAWHIGKDAKTILDE